VPALGALALHNKIDAYCFPQGVISALYREIAARRPGVITTVGLNTCIDPRIEGGRMNEVTTDELVELVTSAGERVPALPGVPGVAGRGAGPLVSR
jgi:propionate CoA-transferase